VAITVCSDESYCCGYQNYECCAANQGYRVVDGIATSGDSNITSSSTTLSLESRSGTSTSTTTLSSSTSSQVTASRISSASNVPSPTIIACSDPSWEPNPQNWVDAHVDSELASWWSRTASERGSRTFVDWVSSSFGDTSRGQHCGIGASSSCSAPDCQSKVVFFFGCMMILIHKTGFQSAGGPRWVYFVRVSLVELNTLFNVMNVSHQYTILPPIEVIYLHRLFSQESVQQKLILPCSCRTLQSTSSLGKIQKQTFRKRCRG
jgi:hypothetical protein